MPRKLPAAATRLNMLSTLLNNGAADNGTACSPPGIAAAPKMGYLLSCPQCAFITSTLAQFRGHIIQQHGAAAAHGVFKYQIYVCSGGAAASTDCDIIRDHLEQRHAPGAASVLLQTVKLSCPGSELKLEPSAGGGDYLEKELPLANGQDAPPTGHDWSRLVGKALDDKKFVCLTCSNVYPGRTEAVFHQSTRHLLGARIAAELQQLRRMSEALKHEVRRHFAEGMRIKAGVHYKNADLVEQGLFLSVDLHVRRERAELRCSDCHAAFADFGAAARHVNDKLKARLPEFMKSRSCPWSLHAREEWVWLVDEPAPVRAPLTGSARRKARVGAHTYPSAHRRADIENVVPVAPAPAPAVDIVPPAAPADVREQEDEEAAAVQLQQFWVRHLLPSQRYGCSHCPQLQVETERAAKLHLLEEHLQLRPALCPYCPESGSQRDIRLHCSSAHPARPNQYVCNAVYLALLHQASVREEHQPQPPSEQEAMQPEPPLAADDGAAAADGDAAPPPTE